MFAETEMSAVLAALATTAPGPTLDCYGGFMEILSKGPDFWVLRGIVPPGSVVPAHSHDDAEDFLILSGSQQVLVADGDTMVWRDANAGDYIRVPGNAVHAHRNVTDRPAVDLVITTPRLGRFFEEVGRPVTPDLQPPTAEEVAQFVAKSAEYGYQLASVEQNAAYGIELPVFSG
ncbi:cupin domain-containing protein [Mycolicibacterium hodleri]|uniref:cupin domain-containing protein n=1 Tax=Mycolicibacterium hodleri TaxID=49897 RepID=UPI0021F2E8AC|nr:cupin domain-containing protein [Mycolicibacterium hodleri]